MTEQQYQFCPEIQELIDLGLAEAGITENGEPGVRATKAGHEMGEKIQKEDEEEEEVRRLQGLLPDCPYARISALDLMEQNQTLREFVGSIRLACECGKSLDSEILKMRIDDALGEK